METWEDVELNKLKNIRYNLTLPKAERRRAKNVMRYWLNKDFRESQRKSCAKWRKENPEKLIFHSLKKSLRKKYGRNFDEDKIDPILQALAKTLQTIKEIKNEKRNS